MKKRNREPIILRGGHVKQKVFFLKRDRGLESLKQTKKHFVLSFILENKGAPHW